MRKNVSKKCLFMLIAIFTLANKAHAIPAGFDATAGIWNVSATDVSGLTWDNSTLIFETQVADGSDFLLGGYFNWEGSNGAFGRENFTGNLFSNNVIQLLGFELVAPTSGIVLANYSAFLSNDGTEIINGSWNGGSVIPSDDWSAKLQLTPTSSQPNPVPEPATMILFGSGIVGAFIKKKKLA